MSRFTGRTALVTGSGAGIGRATALAFAREGAHVLLTGRRADPLRRTAKLIADNEGTATPVTADITDDADLTRLFATITRDHGRLHVAVNNVGALTPGTVTDIDPADWEAMLATNVTGTWRAMRHQVEHMRAHGGGAIVNLSSRIGPHRHAPGMGAYGATKAAVSSLTKAAAHEHIRDGVRINAVSPGPSDTPMSMRPGETEADRAERMRGALPIGRVGAVEEIASAVLWLASDEAAFTVGADLVVDGGSAI